MICSLAQELSFTNLTENKVQGLVINIRVVWSKDALIVVKIYQPILTVSLPQTNLSEF